MTRANGAPFAEHQNKKENRQKVKERDMPHKQIDVLVQ